MPDGEETKWVDVWVDSEQLVDPPQSVLRLTEPGKPAGCGGGCPKAEAVKLARENKWSADELVKVLKALQ